MRTLEALVVVLASVAWAPPAWSEAPRTLDVSWTTDGALTGGALLAWGASALAKGRLSPLRCRWCSVDGLDTSARSAIAWSDRGTAAAASDALQLAVPAGIALYDLFAARSSGAIGGAPEDVLVIAEAVAVTGVLTEAVKYASARIRPYAYGHADAARDDHLSFWSGHTVVAFSAAAAGGTVARLRGYPGWPWVYAVGFTGAGLTGYFRVASDKHWLTDVLASAAVGTGLGILIPWLHRAARPGTGCVLLPTPGGVALEGEL